MKLQKNTSLALYSVLEFARDPTRQISASEIAEKYGVSPHHLAKVLSELVRHGIVTSVRGVGGGYRFTGNARRLTLMDIVQRFEDITATPDEHGHPDSRSPVGQALGEVLNEIDEIARATFSSITLATMLRMIQKHAAAQARREAPAPGEAPPRAGQAPQESAADEPAPRSRKVREKVA